MKIRNILATKGTTVVTARPEQTLREAVALLVQHNIGAMVVLAEAGHVVGVISERDVIRAVVAHGDAAFALTVGEVMTKAVIVGAPSDDVMSVMHTMTEKRFRHLPVMEQGKLIGIVSIGDMVKAQLDEYQGEIDTLETQIIER